VVGIIIKNYEHFNRSLPNWDNPKGKYIGSKAQYEKELAKHGMVSYEKCEQMVAKNRHEQNKYDGLSPEKMKFLHQVKDMADKKGNIPVTDRFVKGLKKHKVIGNVDMDKLPKHYREGGFE
jgi:hypothetical protein